MGISTSDHLIKTNWGQKDPWNSSVPFVDGSTAKCVAGCVAISGAQMMYFLHNKLGVPAQMYSAGGYVGSVSNSQLRLLILLLRSGRRWEQINTLLLRRN